MRINLSYPFYASKKKKKKKKLNKIKKGRNIFLVVLLLVHIAAFAVFSRTQYYRYPYHIIIQRVFLLFLHFTRLSHILWCSGITLLYIKII